MKIPTFGMETEANPSSASGSSAMLSHSANTILQNLKNEDKQDLLQDLNICLSYLKIIIKGKDRDRTEYEGTRISVTIAE